MEHRYAATELCNGAWKVSLKQEIGRWWARSSSEKPSADFEYEFDFLPRKLTRELWNILWKGQHDKYCKGWKSIKKLDWQQFDGQGQSATMDLEEISEGPKKLTYFLVQLITILIKLIFVTRFKIRMWDEFKMFFNSN